MLQAGVQMGLSPGAPTTHPRIVLDLLQLLSVVAGREVDGCILPLACQRSQVIRMGCTGSSGKE
jgi:hypothetical protein